MNHGWEKKRLGDICEVLDSLRKPVTKRDRNPGPYPYYGATGIQDYVQEYIFDGNYLLVGEDGAKWGANEKTAYSISGKSWVNNHAHILNFRGNNITQRFIEFFLYVSDLNRFVTGAVVPKLTQKNLISIPVSLPPVELQERIVRELDKLNELIELKRKQLKDLDTLAHSLFYETFGDPIENPHSWELKKFEELCRLSAGGDKPKDTVKEYSPQKSVPIYSNGVENEGLYGYTEFPKILEPSITISGRGTLGIPFIRKNPFVPIIRLIVATPKYDIHLSYLFYLIKLMKLGGKGAAIPQLTVPMVKNILLPVPPIQLQNEVAEKIEAIEEQKRLIESSISDLETLLASRMDYWFND